MWTRLTKAPFFLCVAYHLSFKFLIGSTLFMPTGSHSRSAKYLQQYNLNFKVYNHIEFALNMVYNTPMHASITAENFIK